MKLLTRVNYPGLFSRGYLGISYFLIVVGLVLIALPVGPLEAQQHSVNPGINNHYHGARHADWVPVFESPTREVFAQRHAIVDALGISRGIRIADIGAGTGFFTLLFADRTGPDGIVYAVDIAEDFIRAIMSKARSAGFTNIRGIINNGRDSGLAPQSIDLAFISNTYHHFEYPQDTMRSIYHALSKHGEVVIIDFHKDPHKSSRWVQSHVRSGRDQVIQEMWNSGYRLVDDPPLLRANYFLRFKKRQAPVDSGMDR